MAIIGMRDLLRDPKQVFKQVEEGGEPTVVTRNGRPVAALIPVDSENAERLLLGATPEYSASRREAEHASAEGRTHSLDDAIAEYNARLDTTEPIELEEDARPAGLLALLAAERSSSEIGPVVTLVRSMFGESWQSMLQPKPPTACRRSTSARSASRTMQVCPRVNLRRRTSS